MEESIAARLREINRRFYAEHAEDFADTRPRLAAGVRRVLAEVPAGARVLEVGCGDGKVGRALRRAAVSAYVGVDESEAMIRRAIRYTMTDDRRPTTVGEAERGGRAATETKDEGRMTDGGPEAREGADSVVGRRSSVVFLRADITEANWHAALPAGPYDWVLAFAVLHHVPGAEGRAKVLMDLAARLGPGGRLVMSNWQLTRSERLMRRVRPWAEAGLDETQVEPGDFLLGWERGGRRGLRYVHVIDEAEAQALAGAAGLRVLEVFEADGVSGDLAQYVVMRR